MVFWFVYLFCLCGGVCQYLLSAVLAQSARRDMYPVGASAPLPYKLVEYGQVFHELVVFLSFGLRWQIDVRRFATQVLTVRLTANGLVQFGTPIATVYADGTEPITQRLQYSVAQVCQVKHLLHRGAFVRDAKSLGGVRASELAQTEVIGKLHVLHVLPPLPCSGHP